MRKLLVCGLMVLPLVVVGCSKGPAEAALKAADEAIAKVAPDAEKFVPDQFKTLTDAAAAAKASFDKGDYAAALAAAKDLPAKATEVMTAATAKKDELMGQWNVLSKDMPILVADWQKKFDELVGVEEAAEDRHARADRGAQGEAGRRERPPGRRPPRRSTRATSRARIENGASVKAAVDWMEGVWAAVAPAPKK